MGAVEMRESCYSLGMKEDVDISRVKEAEERKRQLAYDPLLKWKHLQQTITWAEENMIPAFRRNRPRVRPTTESR